MASFSPVHLPSSLKYYLQLGVVEAVGYHQLCYLIHWAQVHHGDLEPYYGSILDQRGRTLR